MSRVFLDTNLFIYLFEDTRGPRGIRSYQIFEGLSRRNDLVMTSTLTLGEVLVKPIFNHDRALESKYEQLLRDPHVKLLDFNRGAAAMFSRIRQHRWIKAPDAIQLATAAAAGCDLFITNDERLTLASVPGIHFITSMERAPI